MKINSQSAKRLGIFFFYDKQGIADRYIEYLLKSIRNSLETLYVVVNGNLSSDSHELFDKYASKVIVRENIGFDVWAYKTAIEDIGWDQIVEYDEMIMFNFTIFGPFYPFDEMFHEMDQRNVDFWGITKHYSLTDDDFWKDYMENIPTHIQSHFISVRNNMLRSPLFWEYWANMPQVDSYKEAVGYHESRFTKYFSDAGFKWDVYINTDELKKNVAYPLMAYPLDMLKKGCPIVKRKIFFMDYMENFRYGTYGESTDEILRFIKENTTYDSTLIWENVLRTNPISNIKDCMHLNYIIDETVISNYDTYLHTAVFCNITNLESSNVLLPYLKMISSKCDIYVISLFDKERFADYFGKFNFLFLEANSVKDVLVEIASILENADYQMIGFINDCEFSSDREGLLRACRNMFQSIAFIKGIRDLFDQNVCLGSLTVPKEYHRGKIGRQDKEWTEIYNDIDTLNNSLHIDVELSESSAPVCATNNIGWFRNDILLKVVKFVVESEIYDKSNLKYLLPLLFQKNGYYYAYIYSKEEVIREISNFQYMLEKILNCFRYRTDIEWFGDFLYYLQDAQHLIIELKSQIEGKNKYEFKLENELEKLREYSESLESDMKELKMYSETEEKELNDVKQYLHDVENGLKEKEIEFNNLSLRLEEQIKKDNDLSSRLEEQIIKNDDLDSSLEKLKIKNDDLDLKLEEQIEENEELKKELLNQIDDNKKLVDDIHNISSYVRAIENDLNNSNAQNRQKEEEIARKNRQIDTLILEILEKENELSSVYNSKSWKFLKLFRKKTKKN